MQSIALHNGLRHSNYSHFLFFFSSISLQIKQRQEALRIQNEQRIIAKQQSILSSQPFVSDVEVISMFVSFNLIWSNFNHPNSHWRRSQLTLFTARSWANWITFSTKWVMSMSRARRELFVTCIEIHLSTVPTVIMCQWSWAGKFNFLWVNSKF